MSRLKVSHLVVPGVPVRLDLDDWDALIDALRAGAATFRVTADGVMLSEPYDLTWLRRPIIRTLEIEAHEPFLRFQFGLAAGSRHAHRPATSFLELSTVADDPRGEALFDRVERIALSRTRDKPIVDRVLGDEAERSSYKPVAWFVVFMAVVTTISFFCAGLGPRSMRLRTDAAAGSPICVAVFFIALLVSLLSLAAIISKIQDAKAPAILMTRGHAKKPAPKDGLDL